MSSEILLSDISQDTVVVAMSGGVDSSVAALLLHNSNVPCIGVSMQVWDYRKSGGCSSRATCCAPDDFTDARMVAAKVGIPYYVFDFEKSFQKEVIDNFVQTYARGETPNPCVDCNNKVKFRELRDRASTLGCKGVATGHYARVYQDTEDGYALLRGKDLEKDQSYFLYGTPKQQLSETIFPVGEMTKSEVRQIASEFGLSTASKPESQDICFVSGSVQDFLVNIGMKRKSGRIVRADGTQVGIHEGVHNFTVGQRRGLGMGGSSEPLYVIEINARTNEVIVGTRTELEKPIFYFSLENILYDRLAKQLQRGENPRVTIQVRHRHSGTKCALRLIDDNLVSAELEEPLSIAPGQAAVIYCLDNIRVLGGGRIVSSTHIGNDMHHDGRYSSLSVQGGQP